METHKEELLLLKDQLIANEKEFSACRRNAPTLTDVINHLGSEIQGLKHEIRALNKKIENLHNANPDGCRCRYCGSIKLKRIKGEPHKIFGDMGIVDTLFICLECKKESVITIDTLK
ncbi:hypothetical protein [Nitrosomonas sp. Nm34]|uniref:hypothetical protein n=1 Tax=Nitrosomonas sp. Nm34 TaxID=1881055 RepID=UPI0008E21F0F|nr:hypothetical protein [Nitrosomonas sp. Nm34]SFJ02745.1 hypothetical protein SAMN05428978_10854 [Nitrosomonas sp. Nm34]